MGLYELYLRWRDYLLHHSGSAEVVVITEGGIPRVREILAVRWDAKRQRVEIVAE